MHLVYSNLDLKETSRHSSNKSDLLDCLKPLSASLIIVPSPFDALDLNGAAVLTEYVEANK